MNWTEQAESMLKAWGEAQKQMMSGWQQIMANPAQGAGMSSMMNPTAMMNQMNQMMSMFGGAAGGDATPQKLMGNIFGGQASTMQMLEMLTRAWQSIAPKVESGLPWQGDLKAFTDQWFGQIPGMAGMGGLGDTHSHLTEMMRSVHGEWIPLLGPWMAFLHQAVGTGQFAEMISGSSSFNQVLSLGQQIQPAISGLAELPRAGVARETNAKYMRLTDAMVDVRQASLKYEKAMAEAMSKAVKNLMEHLANVSQKGEPITSVRDLLRTWYQIADKTFTSEFASPEFIAIQNEASGAIMTFRVRQRDVLEMVYNAMDIPTRTEIDDTYKIIHDLKKEVRNLKKAVRALSSGEDASAAIAQITHKPAAASTPRKTTAKKAPASS